MDRTDALIDFDWGAAAPANSMGADGFGARWRSSLVAPTESEYRFAVRSDGGAIFVAIATSLQDIFTAPAFAADGQVRGVGHASFVPSPDGREWWMAYHAHRNPNGFDGVRDVRLQPFAVDAAGRPDLGSPIAAGVRLNQPSATPMFYEGFGLPPAPAAARGAVGAGRGMIPTKFRPVLEQGRKPTSPFTASDRPRAAALVILTQDDDDSDVLRGTVRRLS